MPEAEQSRNEFTSYEGLNAMRVVSSFGVVFLHVCSAAGVPDSLEWLVRFRDFALPVMAMSSFYLLTLSLIRKPGAEKDFGRFFSRRFIRLWLPFFVWTLFYTVFTIVFIPLAVGQPPPIESFSPLVFLTGYRHLWYLQFIFIGSLLAYPLILRSVSNRSRFSDAQRFLFFTGIGVFFAAFYYLNLRHLVWRFFGSEADINLQIFSEQVSRYFLFIPIAIGLGFVNRSLTELFEKTLFRRLSLLLAVIAMLLHVRSFPLPFSQELYGLAVFLVALRPWKKISFDLWQKLVDYSYGIYIVHFFWVLVLWLYLANYSPEISGASVLCATLFVYLLSFVSAVLIRRILPADWLLPLVRRRRSEYSYLVILRFSGTDEKSALA